MYTLRDPLLTIQIICLVPWPCFKGMKRRFITDVGCKQEST